MDEKTLLQLLANLVLRVLSEAGQDATVDAVRQKKLADRIADLAWNGLILLMRQRLATGKELTLDEFGRFEKSADGVQWTFAPAPSLELAHALHLPADEANARLARKAVQCLQEAVELLQHVHTDVKVPVPEEEFRAEEAIWGSLADRTRKLSVALHERVLKLQEHMKSIEAEEESPGIVTSIVEASPRLTLGERLRDEPMQRSMPTSGSLEAEE